MSKEEQELVATYRGMTPENKANFLAYARVALSAQETAKKAMSRPAKKTASQRRRRVAV